MPNNFSKKQKVNPKDKDLIKLEWIIDESESCFYLYKKMESWFKSQIAKTIPLIVETLILIKRSELYGKFCMNSFLYFETPPDDDCYILNIDIDQDQKGEEKAKLTILGSADEEIALVHIKNLKTLKVDDIYVQTAEGL